MGNLTQALARQAAAMIDDLDDLEGDDGDVLDVIMVYAVQRVVETTDGQEVLGTTVGYRSTAAVEYVQEGLLRAGLRAVLDDPSRIVDE